MAKILKLPTFSKFKKPFNLKCSAIKHTKDRCVLGAYGLKVLKTGKIRFLQAQAIYKTFMKLLKKTGRCWIRFNINSVVTRKPQEVRMGGGKASLDHWEINVCAGMILFEFLFFKTKTFPPSLIKIFQKIRSKIGLPIKLIAAAH